MRPTTYVAQLNLSSHWLLKHLLELAARFGKVVFRLLRPQIYIRLFYRSFVPSLIWRFLAQFLIVDLCSIILILWPRRSSSPKSSTQLIIDTTSYFCALILGRGHNPLIARIVIIWSYKWRAPTWNGWFLITPITTIAPWLPGVPLHSQIDTFAFWDVFCCFHLIIQCSVQIGERLLPIWPYFRSSIYLLMISGDLQSLRLTVLAIRWAGRGDATKLDVLPPMMLLHTRCCLSQSLLHQLPADIMHILQFCLFILWCGFALFIPHIWSTFLLGWKNRGSLSKRIDVEVYISWTAIVEPICIVVIVVLIVRGCHLLSLRSVLLGALSFGDGWARFAMIIEGRTQPGFWKVWPIASVASWGDSVILIRFNPTFIHCLNLKNISNFVLYINTNHW